MPTTVVRRMCSDHQFGMIAGLSFNYSRLLVTLADFDFTPQYLDYAKAYRFLNFRITVYPLVDASQPVGSATNPTITVCSFYEPVSVRGTVTDFGDALSRPGATWTSLVATNAHYAQYFPVYGDVQSTGLASSRNWIIIDPNLDGAIIPWGCIYVAASSSPATVNRTIIVHWEADVEFKLL